MADIDCELLPLDGIDLACTDEPIGGLINIWIAEIANVGIAVHDKPVVEGIPNQEQGAVAALGFRDEDEATPTGNGKVYSLDFNKRDTTTGFTEAKVTSADGVSVSTQTLTWFIPKMDREKRNLINKLVRPNSSNIMFLEYASGSVVAVGVKFGIKATEGAGASGANRADRNGFTVTFSAEESELHYYLDDEEIIGILRGKTTMDDIPDTADWEISIASEGTFAPNQDVAPKKPKGSIPAPTNVVGTWDDSTSLTDFTWTLPTEGAGGIVSYMVRYSNNGDWQIHETEVDTPAIAVSNNVNALWVEFTVKQDGVTPEDVGTWSAPVKVQTPPAAPPLAKSKSKPKKKKGGDKD